MSFVDGINESGERPREESDTQQSPVESSTAATLEPESQPSHRRLVFADPAAFRYASRVRHGNTAHRE